MVLMLAICWTLLRLRKDYREERGLMQEVMAHDQNVEKRQMEVIMRRHEAGRRCFRMLGRFSSST